ncbi:DMSO/TMAO reductase YedYZ, molybdopterin-dependent catalytic subunit [Pseudonocardia thermophila]|jgi:Sulfite oxidase and related enzymes|uniref:DMSO/TMAO reductase YedYZ, molybdopterin-dependent catalytic subunit n=1 Tax=Pseudonocardia thermophila TaxID=1848 RepID=A0A1M6YA36_PSETH|nr:molybdopterin-dependent oxidoreductase [Pseudonocardia thermophila]SHL15124.1 DMSO/TMAO reductase YedYZ, molybdopterin-dependent catalytic subunit [Pseudonocardia thermophila]
MRISRPVAALVGVLAVAAAVGAGQLVAGLLGPGSAPLLAVSDAVVRLAPAWLVRFGEALGPERDKLVLQLGVGVVLLVAAAVAGLLSRSAPQPGVRVLIGLGLTGFAAVLFSPTFALLDLVTPLVALGTGIGVFRWLHGLVSAPGEPAADGPSRRAVLAGAAGGVGLAALAGGVGGWALGRPAVNSRADVTAMLRAAPVATAPALPPLADFRESGTPSFLTPNAQFYRIDVALRVPSLQAADWSLRLHGMVERELTLTFADLMSRPLVERDVTLACVSNPVGGDLISTARWTGVELRPLLLEAGVRPGADQLFSRSADGWYTGTPLDVLLEPDRGALLAVGMNGEALPPQHGFPVRMVVPGLYGYVSATKWVVELEATTFVGQQSYWLQRGWAERGPIKTGCRIDRPRPGVDRPPAGPVVVAGTAWAQHTGISRVEVRVDGGPWQEAELSAEVSRDTWRMWRTTVVLPPGEHRVEARATDARGVVQTEETADPLPDGATGWPAVVVFTG